VSAANYEVNIQLNTGAIDGQLRSLERRIQTLRRNIVAPLRAEQQSLRNADRAATLADRRASTMVITRKLGEQLNRLEKRGVDVAKARTALDRAGVATDKGRLETARSLNKSVRDFIGEQKRATSVTNRAGRMATENVNALFNAQRKRYTLDQKIRRLEDSGVNTNKLRTKLGEFTEAQSQRNFGSVQKIGNELDLLVRKEQDRLRVQQNQTREQERQLRISQRAGGPASPLRGGVTMPGSPAALSAAARAGGARISIRGDINTPGSPAFIEAQARERDRALSRAATIGGARSSIRGDVNTPGSPAFIKAQQREIARAARIGGSISPLKGDVNTPGSPAFIEAQARERARALSRAATIGGARSSIRGDVNTPGSPAFIEAQQKELSRLARQGGATSPIRGSVNTPGSPAFIEAQARERANALRRAATLGGPRNPIGGAANIPGSPAFLSAQQRQQTGFGNRTRDVVSNAIIGGAFPLLFGQGGGAAIGGGLGGAIGGLAGGTLGFGLSLVGTVIGQAADEAQMLSKELNNVNIRLNDAGDSSRTTAKDIGDLASKLNITKEEALNVVNAFREFDSAKVREAVAASFGAAGGREGFDALTAIQDGQTALEAIVKLRSELGQKVSREALEQLKINGATAASVFLQQRLATLQDQKLVKQAQEIKNQDRINAFLALGLVGSLNLANLEAKAQEFANKRGQSVKNEAKERRRLAQEAVNETKEFLKQVSALSGQYKEEGRAKPESRAAALQEELTAIKRIGIEEDRIRDLRFANRELTAIEAEFEKDKADIIRDRNKALQEANYTTEKALIIQIASERLANAAALRDDKKRAVEKQRKDQYESILRSVQYETQLIDARMAGREREATIEQKITELKREQPWLQKAQTAEYRKQLELLYQRQDAEELFNIRRRAEVQGTGFQAGFIGDAARAFEDQLAAGKTVERATEVAKLTEQLQLAQLQAQSLEGLVLNIGDAFGQAMTVGVASLVDGTKSAEQIFADFLNTIANALLQTAAQMIATYTAIGIARTFAGVPAARGLEAATPEGNAAFLDRVFSLDLAGPRADGGPVSAGRPYIVGERGPELFMPRSSGSIYPNDALGTGNVQVGSVNITVQNTGENLSPAAQKQIANQVQGIVMSTLVNQKRSGGIL